MDTPVPSLIHSLNALSGVLKKAEAHCKDRKIDPSVLLTARLYPDMFNCISNVWAVCDTAKGAAARLSQTDNPSFEDNESTFAELEARIQKTVEFMNSVPSAAFDGAEDRTVTMKAGTRDLKFVGAAYLTGFAIPNFYFHMTTAYNILRHNGVEIGKVDFLGGRQQ